MALTPDEAATLALLQAKAAEPDAAPAEVAGETAAEVGAAVAGAVAEVASTVAAVVTGAVADANRDELERLERERNEALVVAAVAEINAEASAEPAAELVNAVADELDALEGDRAAVADAEDDPEVVVEEGAAALVIDAAPGATVEVQDSPPEVKANPYFSKRVRMPWQR